MARPPRTETAPLPPLPVSFLARPRLEQRWDEVAGQKLILVTAGAGYGKTTFLSARARAASRPVHWCSLPEDPIAPAAQIDRFLAALAGRNALAVLDDAQVLITSPGGREALRHLVQHAPPDSTLVLASREPLGLPTARLRTRGEAAEFTARDLRFTEEEIGALFRLRFPDATLDPALLQRVAARTEGWPAGVEILFQAAGGPSPWALERSLDQHERAGTGWFAFFAEEVVSRLDPALQEFCLKSAILPRLEPALCDAALAIQGSREHLEELSRRNLFTFPEGPDGTAYRYHHLFRSFLLAQFERRLDETTRGRLRRGTAQALARAGFWAEAATIRAEAGDPEGALHLLEAHGTQVLASASLHGVRRILEEMPAMSLRQRPKALALLGRIQEVHGSWDAAAASFQRARRAAPAGARRAEVEEDLARVSFHRGEYRRAELLCRRAMRGTSPRAVARHAALHGLLGLVYAELGRLEPAERHLREAHRLSVKAGDPVGEGRALFHLAANVHYFRGEFREARESARRALLIFRRLEDPRRTCHALGVLGFLAMASAREREARDYTEEALRLAAATGYRMVEGYCRHTLGRCALLAGDLEAATHHFEAALLHGEDLPEPSLRTLPRLGLAEVALARGNLHAARRSASEARALAAARQDRFHEAVSLVLLGRAGRGIRAARTAWEGAEERFRAMGATYERHRLLLYRLHAGAIAARARTGLLRELLEGVARMEHEFLFLELEPDRAARVLCEGLASRIDTEFTAGILVRLGPRVVPALRVLLETSEDAVRSEVVDILARIGGPEAHRALSRAARFTGESREAARRAAGELELAPAEPLHLRAFGSFEIRRGAEPLPVDRFGSARALRLLQVLLVHRFRWVPKEVVIEALWPAHDPDRAESSLRQSVLLLRRALEPALDESRLSRYIRFRADAYRLDPGAGYTYDVERFEELIRSGRRLWDEDRRGEAESKLLEAVALYRGSFLAEHPYEESLAPERERLAEECVLAIQRLLTLLARAGRWAQVPPLARRGLELDPLREELHGHLIEGLLGLREQGEALIACQRYEERMRAELDLPPSKRMQELAARAGAFPGTSGIRSDR